FFTEILSFLADKKDFQILNKEVLPHSLIYKNKKRLQNIFNIIEQNYHTKIEIAEVAEAANLTVPAFCNFFKKATRSTFTEFLNHYRIDKSCQFIIGGKSISESSYLVGFNNVSYFNRIFKRYMKKTPSQFRKEFKKQINLQ